MSAINDAQSPQAAQRCTEEAFWERVTKLSFGCWVWNGHVPRGCSTGVTTFKGERMSARLVAWFITHGKRPDKRVLPTCHTAGCLNPDHMRPILTKADAQSIFDAVAAGDTQEVIAARYGCARETISRFITAQTQEGA